LSWAERIGFSSDRGLNRRAAKATPKRADFDRHPDDRTHPEIAIRAAPSLREQFTRKLLSIPAEFVHNVS
jgi:hypothetical protein